MYSISVCLGAACLGAFPLLSGCGGSSGPGSGGLSPRAAIQGLSVSVATDKRSYHSGEPIIVTVTVTNDGTARTIEYPDTRPQWGYIIARNGTVVAYEYRPEHQQAFLPVVTSAAYSADETRTFQLGYPYTGAADAYDPALGPGYYQIYARASDNLYVNGHAVLYSEPTPLSDPVTIIVTP